MFRTALVAFAALLVTGFAPVASAQPVDLAPTFEVGRVTRYRYSSETNQQFILRGRTQQSGSSSSDTRATLTVESVSPEEAIVSVVFDSAVVEFRGGSLEVMFDSAMPRDKDPDSPLAAAFRAFLGKPVRCVVSPTGALLRVEGAMDVAPEQEPARRLALQYLSEPNLRWLIDTVYAAKSDPSTAAVGETWKRTRSEGHPMGTLITDQTFIFDANNAGMAEIAIQGTDRVEKLLGAGAGRGAENVEHLPADIKGSLRWDLNKGQADRFELITRSVDLERHPQMGEIRKEVEQHIVVERIS